MLSHRETQILEILKEKKYAKIEEIAKQIYVSEATVRRDVAKLKSLGLLERDHGGAIFVENSEEVHIFVRKEQDPFEKLATAQIALSHLPEFANVFIDNSSTLLALCKLMDFRHKTVVTNGIAISDEISKKEHTTVIVPAGNVMSSSNSIAGPLTVRTLLDMNFDLYLGSCAAINENGTYESSSDQAEIKRVVMANSQKKILLVDRTKFSKKATFRTARLTEYDVIYTNAGEEIIKKAIDKGANIINR